MKTIGKTHLMGFLLRELLFNQKIYVEMEAPPRYYKRRLGIPDEVTVEQFEQSMRQVPLRINEYAKVSRLEM